MEAVILCEFDSREAGLRDDLLGRFSVHALRGEGRLGFVAVEPNGHGDAASEVVTFAFTRMNMARAALRGWRSDPGFPMAVRTRLMRIEPIWSLEPLPLMFP